MRRMRRGSLWPVRRADGSSGPTGIDAAAAPRVGRADPRAAGVWVGRLFEEYGHMVYALSRMLLRTREEAEDATQEAFLDAYRSLLAGVVPKQPAAWLATIARNECYRPSRPASAGGCSVARVG